MSFKISVQIFVARENKESHKFLKWKPLQGEFVWNILKRQICGYMVKFQMQMSKVFLFHHVYLVFLSEELGIYHMYPWTAFE